MKTILLVAWREITVLAGGKMFWIFTLALPLLLTLINVTWQSAVLQQINEELLAPLAEPEENISGYVDPAGLLQALPEALPGGQWQAFPDEAAAQAALQAEEIDHYFVIAPDYLESGDITAVSPEQLPLAALTKGEELEEALNAALLEDAETAVLYADPLPEETVTIHRLAPETAVLTDAAFSGLMGVFLFFFFFLFSGGQYMLRGIRDEKENRTLEVILLSVNPRHFLWGKMAGLSVISLLQMAFWGLVMRQLTDRLVQTPDAPTFAAPGADVVAAAEPVLFPPSFYWQAGLFLLLGFFMITAFMLLIGVIAPNTRNAAQISGVIMFILMFTFTLNMFVIRDPDAVWAVALSLAPLTAPLGMTARLAVSNPPVWQVLLSYGGLFLTIYLLMRLSAHFIRPDTLLTGLQRPSLRRRQPV
ncbi:MAG TPA: ABC transporter permease [Chloroflexi bacterium]|nr:ABC transporter permease [Chloroflexota bacterium]